MQIGMIGLGRMGWGLAERLRRHGHDVVGFDMSPDRRDVATVPDLVAALDAPRNVWVMVPAGDPVEATVDELAGLLDTEDVVIEGGNSRWSDSVRRGERLADAGIGFVDVGVSGGVWGLEHGFALMAGGRDDHVERLRPAFEALAPPGGFAHVGPLGAGHFTKMVHNAIEYGMMQAYAEGYELMGAAPVPIDVPAALEAWRHGSVVRSWLLDLMAKALEETPGLEGIRGYADDSGHGRWAVHEAVDAAVPVPVMTAALYARFASRQEDAPAMQMVAALRNQFGGHAVQRDDR